jgi:hypothetical protein
MKRIASLFVSLFFSVSFCFAQEKVNIVVIGAHPDDCDIDAGGTAILFAKSGHNVLFVSVTNGDAGHHEKGGGALARIRRAESEEAGKRFGVKYVVLDNHDGELMPTLDIRLNIIRLNQAMECRCGNWTAPQRLPPRPPEHSHFDSGCGVHGDCSKRCTRYTAAQKKSCISLHRRRF